MNLSGASLQCYVLPPRIGYSALMNGPALLVLLVVLLVPLAILIGLGLWARWLCTRTSAPRWLVYPPASLPAVVSATGVVVGVVRASASNARLLGEGISDAMNLTALGMGLAVLAAAWLLAMTWRYRWSVNRAP